MSNNRIYHDDSDFKYVFLSQNGDIDAFGVLVERHQKNMLNLAYRIIGDYDEACDITQEAFLSAYRAIRKFRGDALFSTWLCRIVINVSKNHLKQLKNYKRDLQRKNMDKQEERTPIDDPPDPSPSVSEEFERKKIQTEVQTCIKSLEANHREVLVLRDIQGFSYEEICEILKIPEGTVKSRLSRAREALKDCLKTVLGEL